MLEEEYQLPSFNRCCTRRYVYGNEDVDCIYAFILNQYRVQQIFYPLAKTERFFTTTERRGSSDIFRNR